MALDGFGYSTTRTKEPNVRPCGRPLYASRLTPSFIPEGLSCQGMATGHKQDTKRSRPVSGTKSVDAGGCALRLSCLTLPASSHHNEDLRCTAPQVSNSISRILLVRTLRTASVACAHDGTLSCIYNAAASSVIPLRLPT